MRDIARALKVDPSTVSLALGNDHRISAEMREKIQQTAHSMGYQRDPGLAALSHYRLKQNAPPVSWALAWLNFWSPPERALHFREFQRYWQGATETAGNNGYHLEEFRLNPADPFHGLDRMLQTRNIRGILLPPINNNPDLRRFDWSKYAVIRFGRSCPLPFHMVVADQAGAGQLAFEKIHARGYRRIGFVTTDSAENSTLFQSGFLLAQDKKGGATIPTLELFERDPQKDQQRLKAWLRLHRPDALFSPIAALRTMLEKAGLRVPDDIGLAATSVLDGCADAGIDQGSEELGRIAVEWMISLIHHHRYGLPAGHRFSSVAPEWVDGGTLPVLAPSPERLCQTR